MLERELAKYCKGRTQETLHLAPSCQSDMLSKPTEENEGTWKKNATTKIQLVFTSSSRRLSRKGEATSTESPRKQLGVYSGTRMESVFRFLCGEVARGFVFIFYILFSLSKNVVTFEETDSKLNPSSLRSV